jgi:hypothetical protein
MARKSHRTPRARCKTPFAARLGLEHLECRRLLTIATVASFNGANGAQPFYLTADSSGNLYGVTESGEIFEVAKGSGTITSLASLTSAPYAVVADGAGDLYWYSNNYNNNFTQVVSTIYELPHDSGTITALTSFNGLAYDLVVDSSGDVYGAMGSSLLSSLFEVAKGSGTITTIGSFDSGLSGLAVDSSGNVYGATSGEVFEFVKGSGTISNLASFTNSFVDDLVIDNSGNVYVAEQNTVANPQEFVEFAEIEAGSGRLTTLATLDTLPHSAHGLYLNGFAADSSGNLYVAMYGLPNGIYEVVHGSGALIPLALTSGSLGYNFEIGSVNSLVIDSDGNLYGASPNSAFGAGNPNGSVFELETPIVWTGQGANNLWSNPANWLDGMIPGRRRPRFSQWRSRAEYR